MKYFTKRILAFLLCILMLSGHICEISATTITPSPETVSVSENTSSEDLTTDESVATDPTTDESAATDSTAGESAATDSTAGESAATDDADTGSVLIEEEIKPQTQAEESTIITAWFYDSDGTTLLFSLPMEYKGSSIRLNSVYPNYYDIFITRKGYQLDYWYCPATDVKHTAKSVHERVKYKADKIYTAVWETKPYTFDISYELNGGSFPKGAEIPNTFTVESETIPLTAPVRKGYLFDGWYTDAGLTTATTAIAKGTYIDSDSNGEISPYKLYAKWVPVMAQAPKKPKAVSGGTGKIKVTFSPVSDVQGYEITYGTSKTFKKNVLSKDLGLKTSFTMTNLPKGKKYYFKVRSYNIDSTGQKCYSAFSTVASYKVKKGVTESPAKSNSGKLKQVSVINGTDLYVKATVAKRLKSADDFYYLVTVDPYTGKVLKQVAKTDKSKSVTFRLPLKDENGTNLIYGKYAVAVKKGKKYMLISSASYINNPEAAASYTAPFPTPVTKKGRQGRYDSRLGDKNYFANFNLDSIIATKESHHVAYQYNGKTYYFYRPNFGALKTINEDGGTVTIQVMLKYDAKCTDLILKSGRTPGAHYYAFNTETKAAREKLEAAFCFLAEEGSKQNYHVDNWILGNEVNTYANMNAKWYYAGNISRSKFIKTYAHAYRTLYYAVKSNNKNGRVYICCDHTWINRENDWGTKYFTKAFHDEIKSQNKNIKWNLAYHAYSAVLTNADFWNDGKLAPNNINADFVSPNNLEILTNYIKKNFGKDVRIILSEQGFSYSGGTGSPYNVGRQTGEDVQAAAITWLYYKAQFNNMIDAVIFSTGDHGGPGYQFDIYGHKAENVYKYMDTPQYEAYTKDCLKTIGKSSWKSAVKGFKASKLKQMPDR